MAEKLTGQTLTLRVELENQPGTFARLASTIAEQNANLGSVDIVSTSEDYLVRDVSIAIRDPAHADAVINAVKELSGINLINVSDQILQLHHGGKIEIRQRLPIKNRHDLSQLYTPGVANVCRAIQKHPNAFHTYTIHRNTVAIVTDGSAVIGLGDIGPEAALPVMEGKSMIYREFAGLNGFPVCLRSRDLQEIVATIVNISTVFGAINLEDIESSRCYEIQKALEEKLEIPVLHDVHDGSSVVVLAGLQNALRIVGKTLGEVRIVVHGVNHRSMALTSLLLEAGVTSVIAADPEGAVFDGRGAPNDSETPQRWFAQNTNRRRFEGDLGKALQGADVFVSVQPKGRLGLEMLQSMNPGSIVFQIGDLDPSISSDKVASIARVTAANRADTPNQIDSILASPGMLRGALDVNASRINAAMKFAAARALAETIHPTELSEDHILPSIFNPDVVKKVSRAVAAAALKSGVARRRRRKVAST